MGGKGKCLDFSSESLVRSISLIPIVVNFYFNQGRAGGSTNVEKKRKKNFAMSKFSFATRQKMGEKGTAKQGRKKKMIEGGRDSKKRRRKV